MNTTIFLANIMKQSIYELKQGTSTSYYFKSGDKILPDRISITKDDVSHSENKGRNLKHPKRGQLLGKFKETEESSLKLFKPYNIRTELWVLDEFPSMRYGTIGISNQDGKIDRESDCGDVVIVEKLSDEEVKISYFPAIGEDPDLVLSAHSLLYKTRKGLE